MRRIIIIITLLYSVSAVNALTVVRPMCEHAVAPLGVEARIPCFGWQIYEDGKDVIQKAYQIEVFEDLGKNRCVWNSGKVADGESLFVEYDGSPLKSATRYHWHVRVWNSDGQRSPWSEDRYFTTGLWNDDDWQGALWICLEKDKLDNYIVPGIHTARAARNVLGDRQNGMYLMPQFRKEVKIGSGVKRSVACICGLGHFDLFINGQKAGGHFLDGGWTKYDKEAFYVPIDVTELLRTGKNTIGVMLGNGFYNIPSERYFKLLTSFGSPKLRMLFTIEYDDGHTEKFITDQTWRVTESPIVFSSIYGGEDYDATHEQTDCMKTGFDDSSWQQPLITSYTGELHAEEATPVSIHSRISTKSCFKNQKGQWVYDLGQNFSGVIDVAVKATRKSRVIFRPAELLNPDSTVNQSATGSPYYFSITTKNIPGSITWHPQFTYYGFRYVQLEGAVPEGAPNPDGFPVVTHLEGLHTCNTAAVASSFSCSNSLFNSIHELIDWAIRSNMQSVLTDCPHREKLGWIEQDYLMQPSLQYRYQLQRLYPKIVNDMSVSQRDDGCVPSITPEYVRFADGFEDSPEWGSAFIIAPWIYYQWYGDPRLIRRHYPAMKHYVDYLGSKAQDNIVAYGLGDWFDIGPKRPGPAQLTSNGVTSTAIYYYDVVLLSKMARMQGLLTDALRFEQLASDIKESFHKRYVNPVTKVIERNSQTANAIAICTGIIDKEERNQALQNLIADIETRNYQLTAGDIGYYYLLAVLQDAGRSDIIFKMNNRSDVPGYGWQLAHGATALTESWQAYGFVSNNHFMLGHLMQWLYSGLAGIRQQEGSIGFKRILIAPQIVEGMTNVEASFDSPYGKILSHWRIQDNRFLLDVVIPSNTSATIVLPDGISKEVSSGEWHFISEISNLTK